MRSHGTASPAGDVGHSTVALYERIFGAFATRGPDVPRPPHWWVPCAINYALHSLGYPLGEVVARGTADLRRELRSADLTPKVFVRVDDYPHWSVSTDRFWEFHAAL